ncbi:MAG: glycosyltransferase family 39 protein [Bacteroidota bacterium]|nr:glycosyltransferase family 39 protein [Bacteroidota bacterium]
MKKGKNNKAETFYKWIGISIAILLFAAIILQVGYRIGKEQIKVWDESSSARNSVIMMSNQDYIVIRNNGIPDHYDVNPPFGLWLKIISYKIFGVTEFAVRFPSLVSAILTALLLFSFCTFYLKQIWLGNLLLAIMASTSGYMGYHVARTGDPDTLLTLIIAIYSIAFFVFLEKYPDKRIKFLAILGFMAFLAIFTKSIAGVAPMAGLAFYSLTQAKGRKMLLDYRIYITAIISLILASSYYIIRELVDEGFLQAVYVRNFKVIQDYYYEPKHPEFSFYINYLWTAAFKPFFYFVPLSIIPAFFSKNNQIKRLILFSFIAATTILIGQSSIEIKNEWYIAPIYPFLWLLCSLGIYGTLEILLRLIKNIKIKRIVSAIIILVLLGSIYPLYLKKFKENYKCTIKNAFIYHPEREGDFLRKIKKENPEFKSFKVISPYAKRSTDFYVQKFKYLDNTNTLVFQSDSLPVLTAGDTIIACSAKTKMLIEKYTNFELIDEKKYCKLYVIK